MTEQLTNSENNSDMNRGIGKRSHNIYQVLIVVGCAVVALFYLPQAQEATLSIGLGLLFITLGVGGVWVLWEAWLLMGVYRHPLVLMSVAVASKIIPSTTIPSDVFLFVFAVLCLWYLILALTHLSLSIVHSGTR